MLDLSALSAQTGFKDMSDYIEWVIAFLTIVFFFWRLRKPVTDLQEKIDKQMESKADQVEVDKLRADIDCRDASLKQEIKDSENRTVERVGERIEDLQKVVLQYLNKN
jgi:hypothetical protein